MRIFKLFVLLLLVVVLADFTLADYYDYVDSDYDIQYEDATVRTQPFEDGVEVKM